MTAHKPCTFKLCIDKVNPGTVRVSVHDVDEDHADTEYLIWECLVSQDSTNNAKKEALLTTARYLNKYVDYEGGTWDTI